MALINRVSRLFRADLHAVLDRIEEPAILLRQAVREMEEELARAEQRARLLAHERAQAEARADEIAHSLASLSDELDVCFDNQRDDLARGVIRRRLEAQARAKLLAGKRSALDEASAELHARIEENRQRLESTRQKAELFADEADDENVDSGWRGAEVIVRDEDVELALLREQQRRRNPR